MAPYAWSEHTDEADYHWSQQTALSTTNPARHWGMALIKSGIAATILQLVDPSQVQSLYGLIKFSSPGATVGSHHVPL
jgi:hypothetical protein